VSIENKSLPTPTFSLSLTGVNPLQGFIRPALRAKGSRPVETLNPRLAVERHATKL
jgi:hypothetical protein